MEVTVKKLAGKLVAEIPDEALELLGVSEGDKLSINPGRVSELLVKRFERDKDLDDVRLDIEYAEQMAAAREIMDEDRDVLAKLAQ